MRTHERVMARIEADIAAGRLALGDRLPGERVLAEQLGVSRPSVREAVRVLEALGVIRTATGSGPDAGAILIADAATGIGAALRLHVATSSLPVRDVVELRLLVESWGMRAAAERVAETGNGAVPDGGPDPAALDRAASLLDEMDAPGLQADAFLELDAAFHSAVVGTAGNALVTAVMTGVRGAVLAYVRAGARTVVDWDAMSSRLRAEHRAILGAVTAGAADEAERAVRAHIEGFYRDSGVR